MTSGNLPPPVVGAASLPTPPASPSVSRESAQLFVSYARPDAAAVRTLGDDLARVSRDVWFDRELESEGGQQWWDVIIDRIRSADLFVFMLSPDSVRSEACRSELRYAVALRKPLIPIMVRDTDVQLAPDPIGTTQYVDARRRTPESATALTVAVLKKLTEVRPLPDPLPEPPPAPVVDLGPLRDQLSTPDPLDFATQRALVDQLTLQIGSSDQHDTLLRLAEQFLRRPELVVSVKQDLERLIARLPVSPARRAARQRRSLADLAPDTVDLLRALVAHIDSDPPRFTPIIGPEMVESLVGPIDDIAQRWSRRFNLPWAKTFDLPLEMRRRDDLSWAAQFVEVMNNVDTLRTALTEELRSHLLETYGEAVADASVREFNEVLSEVWESRLDTVDHDPHFVLAGLPCPIYVVADPWAVMTEALKKRGKEPVVELCRWRPDVYEEDWPPSVFDAEPGYVPSAERPLVYHVFGTVDVPDSLVLSADDYLDFLIRVTEEPGLIPKPVRRTVADSALLLLGFGLDGLEVRVLMRALISQQAGHKLNRYSHLGAQADFERGVDGPTREQKYLERYFGKYRDPSIDIFWGSIDEFAAGLAELRNGAGT